MQDNRERTTTTIGNNRETKAEVVFRSISQQNQINNRLANILDKIREGETPNTTAYSNTSDACDPTPTVSTLLNSGADMLDTTREAALSYISQIEQELF